MLPLLAPRAATAQGVSTAGIRGTVTARDGHAPDARVRITSAATGASIEVRTTGGRFVVQGLEPGGPYEVAASAIGFTPVRSAPMRLSLGELRTVHLVLEPIGTRLDSVVVVAAGREPSGERTIDAATLDRIPARDRDLFDYVRLVPGISTRIPLSNPGLSAAGSGFRTNDFLVNGVSDRTLGGNVSSAFAGVRSLPLAAIEEYQVLLSPWDVRYGDFSGALVNAVTRSGTNAFHGSVFAYGSTDHLARSLPGDSTPPFERAQVGLALGGPIVRDRLHFFVASELQHLTWPADGPFVGQAAGATPAVPVGEADLARFDAIMRGHGLVPGSAGAVENGRPLRNLFVRTDLALPELRSRLVGWHGAGTGDELAFSRASSDTFSLDSYQVTRASRKHTTALQLHTSLRRAGGGHNELLAWRRSEGLAGEGAVAQPIVRVTVPSTTGGSVTLNSGTHETAQGVETDASAWGVRDQVTLAVGRSHAVTLGVELERFTLERRGVSGAYGAWSFDDLDALAAGTPARYEVRLDFGTASTTLGGTQYAAYAGDRWQKTDAVSLTWGLRADLLDIGSRPPYNATVDSMYGRRTDEMPRARVELSPRLGLTWRPPGEAAQRLDVGVGLFASRWPLAWAQTALSSHGTGGGTLRCNYLGGADRYPPPFDPDHTAPPTACGGGFALTPSARGDVDLLDPGLRMMRALRGAVAYERALGASLLVRGEALFTRALSDFLFVNLALPAPVATDPHGRVMYGTLGATGLPPRPADAAFAEVIEVRNTDRNRARQLSARLETTRRGGINGSLAYTHTRARDVQTPTRVNTRGTVAWASARATGGRHDDLTAGISGNDVPHRVILAGSWTGSWRRIPLMASVYWVGESGRPVTYLAYGTSGRGDLNADGAVGNDPVYVPRSALDTSEIRFSGFAPGADNSPAAQAEREGKQRTAFEQLIDGSSCLRGQRGRVMERNGCREPWSNATMASLRVTLPVGGHEADLQLDVFNVLNLLNAEWGLRREAVPGLLEHVGQTGGPAATSHPVFRYDTAAPRTVVSTSESAYQLQLGVRYRF